jgi:hypothetical protein
MRLKMIGGIVLCSFVILVLRVTAQEQLAATLEVLEATVEVKRVNTANWLQVNVEAIVGVGDEIRTGAEGRARVTFFADGTDTELEPNTIYRIDQFTGNADEFQITASVLAGQTLQRLGRLLSGNSKYEIQTPAMTLGARGTQFALRVEETGRSAMIVYESRVVAVDVERGEATVESGFGVRAATKEKLSDVVKATTFAELDAALDGCLAQLKGLDDMSFNVRLSPNRESPRVGTLNPDEITTLMGRNESGNWYRVTFEGGFGWLLATQVDLDTNCAGLRVFPDAHAEDPRRIGADTDPLKLEPETTPEATPETGS